MNKTMLLKPIAVAALLGAASLAQASLTVYTTKTSFLAAAGPKAATDTFEDLVAGTQYAGPLSRSAGPVGYLSYVVNADDGLLYGAGSKFNTWLSNNRAPGTIDFYSFDAGINAAGGQFFGSDINGKYAAGATIYVTATDGDGSVTQEIPNAKRWSFVGFVSDGGLYTVSVSAEQADGPVWGTVNNLILAAVPEPQTNALLLAGLGVIATVVRRRTR